VTILSAGIIACLIGGSLSAQWLNQPTAGIPRTADGKANLAAPAPKTADGKPELSGLWRLGVEIGIGANITAELPATDIQPWAATLSRQRLGDFGKDDPEITGCLPGGPRHITRAGLAKIVQTPTVMVILYEGNLHSFRQIFLNRERPKDLNPTWWGDSVAKWEGDNWWSKAPVSTTAPGWISRDIRTLRLAHDRTLPPPGFRSHGFASDHQRSPGLRQA
jgi:hypothetical protein